MLHSATILVRESLQSGLWLCYMMRLLNASTHRLEELFGESIPTYAILSHVWGVEEVSFNDLQHNPNHVHLAGYHKIAESCRLAVERRIPYVWVDTCCIDKSSSAELSEAINSMFEWYERASECFVYLPDVPSSGNVYAKDSAFRKSRWWTRGWTLQELLAPRSHIFFGRDWGYLFSLKMPYHNVIQGVHPGQNSLVYQITGIDDKLGVLKQVPNVVKLSWASKRQTTRREDIAYCLMGLLGIQMPLLYGEGDKAFQRLLFKLMEGDNSHGIFLAGYGRPFDLPTPTFIQWGLFPASPAMYDGQYRKVKMQKFPGKRTAHFTITNAGLHIELPMIPISATGLTLAILDCRSIGKRTSWIALPLRPILSEDAKADNEYERLPYHGLVDIDPDWAVAAEMRQFYLRIGRTIPISMPLISYGTTLHIGELFALGFHVLSIFPSETSTFSAQDHTLNFEKRTSATNFAILTSERSSWNIAIRMDGHIVPSTDQQQRQKRIKSMPRRCMFALTKATSVIELLLSTTSEPVHTLERDHGDTEMPDILQTTIKLHNDKITKSQIDWTGRLTLIPGYHIDKEASDRWINIHYSIKGTDGVVKVNLKG